MNALFEILKHRVNWALEIFSLKCILMCSLKSHKGGYLSLRNNLHKVGRCENLREVFSLCTFDNGESTWTVRHLLQLAVKQTSGEITHPFTLHSLKYQGGLTLGPSPGAIIKRELGWGLLRKLGLWECLKFPSYWFLPFDEKVQICLDLVKYDSLKYMPKACHTNTTREKKEKHNITKNYQAGKKSPTKYIALEV